MINASSPSAVNPYVTTSALTAGYVPYTGATANLDLGLFSVTAATAQVGAGVNSGEALEVFQGLSSVKIGSLVGTPTAAAIYLNQPTPSGSNYTILDDTASLYINGRANNSLYLQIGNFNRVRYAPAFEIHTTAAASSGAVTAYTFDISTNTNQTANTAIPGYLFNPGTRSWITANISSQREFVISSPTYAASNPSTIAEVNTLAVTAGTIGANVAITNNFAIGLYAGTGSTKIGNLTGSTSQSAIYMNKATPSALNYTIRDDGSGNSFLNGGQVFFAINGTSGGWLDSNRNWNLQNGALATNATNGFLYLPSMPGSPTGTPTSITGGIPLVVDSTNRKGYMYAGGAWFSDSPVIIKDATVSAAFTGSLTETKIFSKAIPANSLLVGDLYEYMVCLAKTTANAFTIRVYVNTADTLSGATLLSTYAAGGSAGAYWHARMGAVVSASNTKTYPTGVSFLGRDASVAGANIASLNINWTVTQYFIVSVQLTNVIDSVTYEHSYFLKR